MNDKLYHVRLFNRTSHTVATRKAPRTGRNNRKLTASGDDVVSPMHGVVVEMPVNEGDAVTAGQVVAVVEAMKMMNEIRAHKAGTVAKVLAKPGETVESYSVLATIQ